MSLSERADKGQYLPLDTLVQTICCLNMVFSKDMPSHRIHGSIVKRFCRAKAGIASVMHSNPC